MTNIIQNLLHFLEKSHIYEVGFSPSDKHTHTHANTQTTHTHNFYQLWNGIMLQKKI